MNPDRNKPLLNDLLSHRELEELRASTLDRGLALVRQRRRQRHTVRIVGIVASLLGAVAVCWFLVQSRPDHALMAQHPPAAASDAAIESPLTAGQPSDVRQLSDHELLDLFPGRPVALIGPPGQQRLVFLDERR
jgi:hypothetical protein